VYRPGFTITTTGRGLKTQTRRYVAGQRDFVTLLAVMQMEIIGTVGFRVWGGGHYSDGLGFTQWNWTSAGATPASILRGNVCDRMSCRQRHHLVMIMMMMMVMMGH